MENESFIKLYRKFENWEWYTDIPTKTLFLHLLLKASYKDSRYRGQELSAGTVVTGLDKLSIETGLSVQQVRTALKKLISTNEVTNETSGLGSLIHLNNWKNYQGVTSDQHASNKQITNDQQTSNKRVTTYKESNKVINKESNKVISDSKKEETEVSPSSQKKVIKEFFESRGQQQALATQIAKEKNADWNLVLAEIQNFVDYWQEPSSKGKQRWEDQKFFELRRRLGTWFKNVGGRQVTKKEEVTFNL